MGWWMGVHESHIWYGELWRPGCGGIEEQTHRDWEAVNSGGHDSRTSGNKNRTSDNSLANITSVDKSMCICLRGVSDFILILHMMMKQNIACILPQDLRFCYILHVRLVLWFYTFIVHICHRLKQSTWILGTISRHLWIFIWP